MNRFMRKDFGDEGGSCVATKSQGRRTPIPLIGEEFSMTVVSETKCMRRPRNASDSELEKVGVEIVNPHNFHLHCLECGQIWSPEMQGNDRLPRGYWKCPNGCNT